MSKDAPLMCSIEDGELFIRIGIETLAWSLEHHPDLLNDLCEPRYKVTGHEEFSRDVLRELEREEEDGTTIVHLLLDRAMNEALEQGSCAIEESDAQTKDTK
jgi:hypothetical protein